MRARQAFQTKIIDFSLGSCSCKCRTGSASGTSLRVVTNSRNLGHHGKPPPSAYIIPAPSWRFDDDDDACIDRCGKGEGDFQKPSAPSLSPFLLSCSSAAAPPLLVRLPLLTYFYSQISIDFGRASFGSPPRNSPTRPPV